MSKNFSVLLNSRGRPLFLTECVSALNELAEKPSQIEILIGIDDDDKETQDVAQSLEAMYTNVRVFSQPRTKNLHRFINKMAKSAEGKYLWVINDDASVLDLDWDTKIAKAIELKLLDATSRVGYFFLPTNSADKIGDYAEFPLVTREAYEALGFFEFDGTNSWGADVILHKIYNAVNRVFRLNCLDYPIRHIYHEAGTQQNQTRSDMEKVFIEEFAPGDHKKNGEAWNIAVGNFRKFIDNFDVAPYTAKLNKVISG